MLFFIFFCVQKTQTKTVLHLWGLLSVPLLAYRSQSKGYKLCYKKCGRMCAWYRLVSISKFISILTSKLPYAINRYIITVLVFFTKTFAIEYERICDFSNHGFFTIWILWHIVNERNISCFDVGAIANVVEVVTLNFLIWQPIRKKAPIDDEYL